MEVVRSRVARDAKGVCTERRKKMIPVIHYIQSNWAQIGVIYLVVLKFLTAIQDAVDSEPAGLKPPLGKLLYYMSALSQYLFLGNRPTAIGGTK